MSRICVLTGKKANVANNRSHSNRATKRLQGVNLQTRRMGGVKVVLSTRALKTLRKLQSIQKGETLTKKQKKQAKTAARKALVKK
ncbi:MAG: 50S ribosomal protein L28 [Patescibacteria group bacterium]|jgi:large subunit ribosomal protein L28